MFYINLCNPYIYECITVLIVINSIRVLNRSIKTRREQVSIIFYIIHVRVVREQ